jgi:hypothetical protein
MAIVPFLKGRAFDPETVKMMGLAFESVCRSLGLTDKNDPLTSHVAETVIAFMQAGVVDHADELADAVLKEIKRPEMPKTMDKTA